MCSNSKVKIIVRDFAKALIRVYNKAHVIVENHTDSHSYVYLKGGTVTFSSNVLVRN
ncbi:hypothetical protein [Dysgonomonas alginatilytica]|uniref:hypothetical protein n=1 Tax=Dysgonomonas alginatilytica TaxID=1605892 RepID=UPI001474D262|nr:hypothetical protein [Dysgonomonas alginatilytica]